jgi:hypothetical protein
MVVARGAKNQSRPARSGICAAELETTMTIGDSYIT